MNIKVLMGNIFIGKTEAALNLAKYYETFGKIVLLILEPVEEWKYPLAKYYSEPTKEHCYQMQSISYHHFAYSTIKAKQALEQNKEVIVIVERSPEETISIFSKNLKKELGEYYKLLKQLGKIQSKDEIWNNATYIYLSCSKIETLLERQISRIKENKTNSGDEKITKEYLEQLNKLYEKLYNSNKIKIKHKIQTDDSTKQKILMEILKIIDK